MALDVIARGLGAQALEDTEKLNEEVNNLKSIGRFLSNWNCTTGLPVSNPATLPYTYNTGDFYVVSVVATEEETNYRPDGLTYDGSASSTIEDEEIAMNDFYIFDGTSWLIISNSSNINQIYATKDELQTLGNQKQNNVEIIHLD